MEPRTLVLADDHSVLLEGVRRLLEPRYQVLATALDGRELVAAAVRMRPAAVVLDIAMPLLNGIEAARQIREAAPGTKIVFLTQQCDRIFVQEAFRAGASAYAVKQAAARELLTALDEAFEGRYFVSRLVAAGPISEKFDPAVNPADLFGGSLTPRQREVLQLLAEGKAAKEIAHVLGISVKTVEFHKAAIMDELGLRSTAQMTRYALEHGIVK